MNFIILTISLLLMVFGANLLVNGAVDIANRFDINEFIVGALIVGIGTSLPELAVSLSATIDGLNDVAVGNVIGSNIFNILAILGITSIIYPITINKESAKFDLPFCGIISAIAFILSFNIFTNNPFELPFELSRIDGLIFLILFAVYIFISLKINKNVSNDIVYKQQSLIKTILCIIIGLILLIINCDLFINSAVNIARNLKVSESFISLTIISCGTSMPELVSSVTAAIKKKSDIAIGNIIGSNIFNIAFILGTCSIIQPLNNSNITSIDYFIMILSTMMVICCGIFGKINRKIGLIMLLSFISYTAYLTHLQ